MFKSKSHRNICLQQNYSPSSNQQSKFDFDYGKAKIRKNFVTFDTEVLKTDKQQNIPFNSTEFNRRDKSCKTWTKKSNPSDKDHQELNTSYGNILKQNNTYNSKYQQGEKSFINQKLFASSYHRPLQSNYDRINNELKIPTKLQFSQKKLTSSKQCKSMKNLPTFIPDEQQKQFKIKKNVKLQAYNELLKSSQQLLSKYKRIELQKNKLKNDLKQQKEQHSKSSKRICFLQQKQQDQKYYQELKINIKQPKSELKYENKFQYKNQNQKRFNQSSQKTKYNYTPYDSLAKSSQDKLNKTFTYSKKQQNSSYKPDTSSNSYTNGFNLNKKVDKNLSLSDFELGKCLGQGAFGQVFPAKHKSTNMLVAIKRVKKQSVKHMLDQFIQQIKIQMFLDHPNIVKLYGFFDDFLHFYIIMEYMEGGSLYSYIKKNKTLSLQETSSKLKEVCQGLKFMHDNSILHRDIKPQNVVMTHDVCKLCDFGWSAVCKDRRTTYCGTLDYVSPEIIEGDGYDDCVDIWCIGVLTYELLVGKTPFYNISRKQTMKKIMDCSLQYPQNLPQIAVKFMKRILRKNPQDRTDIYKILQDPFMKMGKDKKIFQ